MSLREKVFTFRKIIMEPENGSSKRTLVNREPRVRFHIRLPVFISGLISRARPFAWTFRTGPALDPDQPSFVSAGLTNGSKPLPQNLHASEHMGISIHSL